MKKTKPEALPASKFKTHHFKSLKGLALQPAPQETRKAAPLLRPETELQEEDEASLFLRSVEGVRRIEGDSGAALLRPEQVPEAKIQKDKQEDVQLFLDAMQQIGTILTPAVSEPEEDADERRTATSRTRQLRRGSIRISDTLDLHGYGKDEALQRLAQFISIAYQRGSKAVLVITGKGLNSPDGPVLQGSVDSWLREQGKNMVVEIAQAPRDKGGSGAVVVFLRTNRTA